MDFRTTILMASLSNLTTGLLLYVLYKVFSNITATKYWAAGGLATGFGALLFVLRNWVPDIYSVAFGNLIILLGYALHVIGIGLYLNLKINWKIPIGFALLSSIPFFLLYDEPSSLSLRVLVSSFSMGTLNLVSAHLLLRDVNHREFTSVLSGMGFLMMGAVLYARLFLFLLEDSGETNYIQTNYLINYLVFVSAFLSNIAVSTGFVLMISGSLQEQLKIKMENERRKNEEKSKFLAMLSHELKTPLSVVQMAIGAKNFNPAMKSDAQESINEMVRIINIVHRIDQLEMQAFIPDWKQFDVGELVQEIVMTSNKAGRMVFLDDQIMETRSDPDLVHVIIYNLLDNALKYSKPESRVEIRQEIVNGGMKDEKIKISVCSLPGDSGWPDEKMLFNKYYRSPMAYNYTGSGLGLYLALGLSEMINAELIYVPTDTHVCFSLLLPRSV